MRPGRCASCAWQCWWAPHASASCRRPCAALQSSAVQAGFRPCVLYQTRSDPAFACTSQAAEACRTAAAAMSAQQAFEAHQCCSCPALCPSPSSRPCCAAPEGLQPRPAAQNSSLSMQLRQQPREFLGPSWKGHHGSASKMTVYQSLLSEVLCRESSTAWHACNFCWPIPAWLLERLSHSPTAISGTSSICTWQGLIPERSTCKDTHLFILPARLQPGSCRGPIYARHVQPHHSLMAHGVLALVTVLKLHRVLARLGIKGADLANVPAPHCWPEDLDLHGAACKVSLHLESLTAMRKRLPLSSLRAEGYASLELTSCPSLE